MAPADVSYTHSAFFYGTLMSPPVLRRVCAPIKPSSTSPNPRTVCPAILPNHRRHRVRHADYPAILPVAAEEESTVRGTFVTSLSHEDIRRLDVFEGDEYERVDVRVRLLLSASPESSTTAGGIPVPTGEDPGQETTKGEEVQAQTYVWCGGRDRLEDDEWDFDEFCREKMWRWAPEAEGEKRGEYAGLENGEGTANGSAERKQSRDADGSVDGTGGRSVGGGFEAVVEKSAQARDQALESAV